MENIKINKENNFDFLRLVFSCFVILKHSYAFLGHPEKDLLKNITNGQTEFSNFGVAGFFIISGYLIFKSVRRSQSLTSYYWNRLIRLFPALIVVLFITVIGCYFIYSGNLNSYLHDKTVWTYIPHNLSLLFLQYNIDSVFKNNPYPSAINGSLWTLVYEFAGYVIISALFFLSNKNKRIATIFLFVFFLSIKFAFEAKLEHWGFILMGSHFFNLETLFLGGAVLAAIDFDKYSRKNMVFITSGILLILSFVTHTYHVLEFILLPLVIISFGLQNFKYISNLGSKIGDMSYGIYIYAFPIGQTLVYFFNLSYLQLVTGTLVISLICGFSSWHLIEKRALRLKK